MSRANIAFNEAAGLILVIVFLVIAIPIFLMVKEGFTNKNEIISCAEWVSFYQNAPKSEKGSWEYSVGHKLVGDKCRSSEAEISSDKKEEVLNRLLDLVLLSWFVTGKGAYRDIFPESYKGCFVLFALKYGSPIEVSGQDLLKFVKTTFISQEVNGVTIKKSASELLLTNGYPFLVIFLDSNGNIVSPSSFRFRTNEIYSFMLKSYEQDINVLFIKPGTSDFKFEDPTKDKATYEETLRQFGVPDGDSLLTVGLSGGTCTFNP